jgi:hypothetical protein
MITRTEKQIAAVFAVLVALAAIAWFTVEPAYGGQEKVTICHATSSETNPFVTLTLAAPAVYGPAGHFNENGTTQAGHEQDYFGECEETEEPPNPCPNGDLNGDAEGFDPNDDCKRPPVVEEEPSTPEQPDHPHIPTCEQVPTICPATPEAPASPESPSPSAPEAPAAPSAETPDFQKELEDDVKKQAKKNGATSGSGSQTPATDALPHTGLPLGLVALLGALLTGTGAWLRRRP